ncbi:MAG TPA: PH domain-containing protein [Longimicrobiales bacterium]
MPDAVRRWVLRLLRIPAEPRVPENARVIRIFRAAPNYYRYRLFRWLLGQLAALAGVSAGLIASASAPRAISDSAPLVLWRAVEGLAVVVFLGQLVFGLALLRLDFELRWYILADRCLRIREGILRVREKTMTFANIQQISIRQNPLQRLLGIADVQVRTAGGGESAVARGKRRGTREAMHEAYFRGVANADEIRDAIRERVRLHRDAGLGDPDEPAPAPPIPAAAAPTAAPGTPGASATEPPAVLAAARELRGEMRELRRALEAGTAGTVS